MDKREFTSHISGELNRNLEDLFNHILEMGGLVESQFEGVMMALTESNVNRAQEVILLDRAVNNAEMVIDKLCAKVLARQHPTASDLRLIIATIRIAIDLERIGDEIVKIAKMVLTFANEQVDNCAILPGYIPLIDMSNRSINMLHDALDGFARVTTEASLKLIQEEESVDNIYKDAYKDVIDGFKTSPENAACLAEILITLRAVERISDHARNIGESIIYLIKGKDVRELDKASLVAFINSFDHEG
ncbi:phosphate signaling complex protein PhoU [Hydrogenovibrio marinus]|uniref:Phosphate-specific transport system accessory protein PhoU n=1 Tax=Hydrogenovibrio marinus TaxID=28885 RepID=A0A067A388_HYDMR|nr:phosphate signaling complex protein PhoU [Hydrogenovibrio marinus]KDN96825.1 PhoU family transcriptional regulator [Hydrogenovibrio marinus]BBN59082.1 phosphate transport system regulatory protein PhoU [Hydrogenovibrio marinus]